MLRRVMWRHSAKQVQSELKIPELTHEYILLKASPQEEEFYQTWAKDLKKD